MGMESGENGRTSGGGGGGGGDLKPKKVGRLERDDKIHVEI